MDIKHPHFLLEPYHRKVAVGYESAKYITTGALPLVIAGRVPVLALNAKGAVDPWVYRAYRLFSTSATSGRSTIKTR